MSIELERYRNRLKYAFPLEGKPSQITIDEGDVDGVDAEDLQRDFPAGQPWDTVPEAAVERNCYSLHFFSDEAYRYYLPAFLSHALSDSDVYQFIVFSLAPDGPLDERFLRRHAGITRERAACVLVLLEDAEQRKGYKHSGEVKGYWMKAAEN